MAAKWRSPDWLKSHVRDYRMFARDRLGERAADLARTGLHRFDLGSKYLAPALYSAAKLRRPAQ